MGEDWAGGRGRQALALVTACAACICGLIATRQLAGETSLAFVGSRTSVTGDANIDSAWEGVWKRKPLGYKAVRRELAGYEDLAGKDKVPADAAVAQGEYILNKYSKVLGAPKAEARPVDLEKDAKQKLYNAFILMGGKKAALYDAATHNKELKGYEGVLSFDDKLPSHAIDGPTGKAVKSSADELSSYSSILDFKSAPVKFLKDPAQKSNAVRSDKDILTFPGEQRDSKQVKYIQRDHRVLQPAAVAAELDAHKNILTFPGDEQDAERISRREAAHTVLDPSYLSAERKSHRGILGSRDNKSKGVRLFNRLAPGRGEPSPHPALAPLDISKELNAYDSILEFPGQRQLNSLKHPTHSTKELKKYSGILDFSGHSASAHVRAANMRHTKKITQIVKRVKRAISKRLKTIRKSPHSQTKTLDARRHSEAKAVRDSKRTMLLDEALLQEMSVAASVSGERKSGERKAIILEPPHAHATSRFEKKLAHIYEEAKQLISEETDPQADSAESRTPAAATHLASHSRQRLRRSSVIARHLRTPTHSHARPQKAREIVRFWQHVLTDRHHTTASTSTSGSKGVEDARERRGRRVVSRDPVIRRLERQAARLREKLQRVREQKQRESLEQDAVSHVLSHKEKLLKLDEKLEDKLTHKAAHMMQRADTGMARMINDDEQKLRGLELRAAARSRRQARQARLAKGMKQLTAVQRKRIKLEKEHALLLAKIRALQKSLPKSIQSGLLNGFVGGGARSGLRVQPDADTEELAQIDYRSPGHGAVLLSATAKLEYAQKLAAAEQLLAEAHMLADGLLPSKPNQHARTDGDVGKIKEDLAGIANVLKDRALHVVLDGKSVDEELHHQQLHELVNAAAAHAEIVLGRGSTTGATALEHVLEEVRDSAEQHPSTSSSSSRREQVLRKLVAQEANRKKQSNKDLKIISGRDKRTGQRNAGGHQHLTPTEVLQETEEALERSGDYVQPLHAATDVALPTETLAIKRSGLGQAVHKPLASSGGAPGQGVHARDGKRTQREEEAQWKKDLEIVGSPDLLKTRDRSDVLSMEGKADENEALKTDISALVDATEHKDVKQYDAMLKAAINKSEKKLARYETAQGDASKQVWGNMASADKVFAKTRVRKQENAVRDAMLAAKRIEKQLHLKFAKNGAPYEIVKAPVNIAEAINKNHYIPGLGRVHKDNGLISAIFKHHDVSVAKAEALESPRLHTLSKRTHARLTDHALFKAKGVLRHITSKAPSAWHMVNKDAGKVLADGTDVGKDVAEVTGWALKGLTNDADAHKASGDAQANSLWHYI